MRRDPQAILARFARAVMDSAAVNAEPPTDRDVLAVFLGAATAMEAEHGASHPMARVFQQAMLNVRRGGYSVVHGLAAEGPTS